MIGLAPTGDVTGAAGTLKASLEATGDQSIAVIDNNTGGECSGLQALLAAEAEVTGRGSPPRCCWKRPQLG